MFLNLMRLCHLHQCTIHPSTRNLRGLRMVVYRLFFRFLLRPLFLSENFGLKMHFLDAIASHGLLWGTH